MIIIIFSDGCKKEIKSAKTDASSHYKQQTDKNLLLKNRHILKIP